MTGDASPTYQVETDRAAAASAWADKINAQPDAPHTLRDLAAYPAHLTEPGASAYPPPTEPGAPAQRGQVHMLDQAGLTGDLDLAARFEELARTARRPRRSITKRPGRAVLAGPGLRGIRGATRRAEAMGRHGATPQLRRIRAA